MKTLIIPALLLFALIVLPIAAVAQDGDAAAHYDAGMKAMAARDFETAHAELEKAMDIDEDYKDVFEQWEIALELADWQETVEGEVKAMDLVRLGEAYQKIGRFADERATYEEAIAKDDNCAEAHGHLALANYGVKGGSLTVVIKETIRFLETSPNQEALKPVLDDFMVYGMVRIARGELRPVFNQAKAVRKADPLKAAAILEAAAADEQTIDVFKTVLLTEAGKMRMKKGDLAGAKKAFTAAVGYEDIAKKIEALLGLAAIETKAGNLDAAVGHLRAAVAVGSVACNLIAVQKTKAFKPLFAADSTKAEMAKLVDVNFGDEPIRKMIEEACAKAKAEGKEVLLQWYGPYCPFVMAMEDRLVRPEVKKIIDENFVFIRMDQGDLSKGMMRGATLDEKYGNVMESAGVPSFFVLNEDGSIRTLQKDIPFMSESKRAYELDSIVEWLNEVVAERE
jgi:tetratricopeptide (TPR) repeat protein